VPIHFASANSSEREHAGTAAEDATARKWKVAVTDDDPAVRDGTRFAPPD